MSSRSPPYTEGPACHHREHQREPLQGHRAVATCWRGHRSCRPQTRRSPSPHLHPAPSGPSRPLRSAAVRSGVRATAVCTAYHFVELDTILEAHVLELIVGCGSAGSAGELQGAHALYCFPPSRWNRSSRFKSTCAASNRRHRQLWGAIRCAQAEGAGGTHRRHLTTSVLVLLVSTLRAASQASFTGLHELTVQARTVQHAHARNFGVLVTNISK